MYSEEAVKLYVENLGTLGWAQGVDAKAEDQIVFYAFGREYATIIDSSEIYYFLETYNIMSPANWMKLEFGVPYRG